MEKSSLNQKDIEEVEEIKRVTAKSGLSMVSKSELSADSRA